MGNYRYGLPRETVEALPPEIVDLLEQGVLPEQIMTDEWDGDPYFTDDGKIAQAEPFPCGRRSLTCHEPDRCQSCYPWDRLGRA